MATHSPRTKYDLPDLQLPGFDLQLEQESHLPSAGDWFAKPLTVTERSMLALLAALKDKPEWDRKVFDENIVEKWRAEALAFSPDQGRPAKHEDGRDDTWNGKVYNGEYLNMDGKERQKAISKAAFDFCISELRDNAKSCQARGFTEALDASACVYMSDTLIGLDTKAALNEGAEALENVKDWQRDWHPGSHGKVLDLVHPSLFPLIYGRSRILDNGKVPLEKCSSFSCDGVVVPEVDSEAEGYSKHFQWLPCEVALNDDGSASIKSYINNLPPAGNECLYSAIESVIAASIPMWTRTILSVQCRASGRIDEGFKDQGWIARTWSIDPGTKAKVFDPDSDEETDRDDHWQPRVDVPKKAAAIPEPKAYTRRERVLQSKYVSDAHISDDLPMDPSTATGNRIVPTPGNMREEEIRLQRIFKKQGLQVIVKLANIHLRPRHPRTYDGILCECRSKYGGGTWHVEGMENEHIKASALYYYNSSNITDSFLSFREGVDNEEIDYERYRYRALHQIYGINAHYGDAIQVLGKIHTREDRLLVFPNVLHHCVSPFELRDKTKPGHRKLLALFLVEPFVPIISTANVPPQQKERWREAMERKDSLTQRLPPELADLIVDEVQDFPISLEEAKRIRKELMEERTNSIQQTMDVFQKQGYNFCEH